MSQEEENMIAKSFKLCLYKGLARFSRLYFYSLFFVVIVVIITAALRKIFLIPKPFSDIGFNGFVFAKFLMLLLLPGILVWGWYFVWFRYVAYGVAWVISLIRRSFKNIFFQIFLILVISTGIWWGRKLLFFGKKYIPSEMLNLSSVIKILVIAAAIFTIKQLIKARKRIFISKFENYTGDEKLEPAVNGVAARILNEANRLSKLIKTIDEIQPELKSKDNVAAPTVDVQEMGKDFEDIIGPESSVEIGKVKIPLKPIFAFFKKLVRGPILSGGVHLRGEKLVITASLKGGKFSGSWEISIDDVENPPTSKFEQVIAITNQLVCRIIAYISPSGSPRWKAMSHYTRALGFYRETLLKREKKKLNLIKAKNEFSLALTDDSKFVQCYYNLGVIYEELKSHPAAIAAFRKALESASDNYRCYYQLALLYYYEENYFDARWFCEQALTICPTEAEPWNLWAIIQGKKWIKDKDVKDDYKMCVDIPGEVVQYFMNATALAWRTLCRSIINGEKIPQCKEIARICIRNLAKITGMRREWRSRCLFRQAVFLAPDNNDLHFEAGRYYYRYYSDYREYRIIKAYDAFTRVFEDDKEFADPFSFWAYYINVNAQLYARKGEQKYKDVVDEVFFRFLDAAAEIIQNIEKYSAKERNDLNRIIRLNEALVSYALNFEKREYWFVYDLMKILEYDKDISGIYDWENKVKKKRPQYISGWSRHFSQYSPDLSKNFSMWLKVQVVLKTARIILEEENDFTPITAITRLHSAIKELKNEYPDKIKRLGLYISLAEGYSQLNLHTNALKYAREAVRLDPYNWEIRKLLGDIYFDFNDYRQAVSEYEISARLEEHSSTVLIKILKKIGEAYEKSGKTLQDPQQRKNDFNKAVEFFTDYLVILEDKSYENNDEENGIQYINSLAEIHFSLGTFYCELLKYDDAITHFKIAREMGYDKLKTLLKIGWTYFECGDFNEAEQVFKEAKPNPDLTSAEIKLGIAFSRVERFTTLNDEILSGKPLINLINETEFNDIERRIDIAEDPEEKSRLSALYHECRGRFYFKQEKIDNAEKEFETSLLYRANPRIYYYLAELYWIKAGKRKDVLKNLYLAKTRSAFSLCLKNDLQQKYKNEVSECLERLSAFEKQPK
jgi:tetratricopeptide (TPR) repeat protein